jgi:hypothetical protein
MSINAAMVPGDSSCHSRHVYLSTGAAKTDASMIIIQVEGEFEWASAHLTKEQAEYIGHLLLHLSIGEPPPTMESPFQDAKGGEQQ